MKKRLLTILFLFLISISLNAQDANKKRRYGKIGLTYSSFGENDIHRTEDLDGSANYTRDGFYTLGITYLTPVNGLLELEMGLEYSKHTIFITPNVPPGMAVTTQKAEFSLINIPVTLRANLFKYFFLNAGIFLDLDNMSEGPLDSQRGIGALFGAGVKYDFNSGVSVFINPYLKLHSLLQYSPVDNHQQIYETGVRMGVTYELSNKNQRQEKSMKKMQAGLD